MEDATVGGTAKGVLRRYPSSDCPTRVGVKLEDLDETKKLNIGHYAHFPYFPGLLHSSRACLPSCDDANIHTIFSFRE